MRKITRKSIAILLVVMSIVSLFCINSFAVGALSFEINEYGYAVVTSCNPDANGTVIVPEKIKIDGQEYEVKTVGANAFANCKNIEVITICEGVTQIENKAFENCTSLKTVDIPKSLLSCQYDAFDGCNTVTVNCYSSNYQFFAVYGFSENLNVNIVDSDFSETTTSIFNQIVAVIRKLLSAILKALGFNAAE